jgi:hypothetical protein
MNSNALATSPARKIRGFEALARPSRGSRHPRWGTTAPEARRYFREYLLISRWNVLRSIPAALAAAEMLPS